MGNECDFLKKHEIIQDFGVFFWISERKLVFLRKFHK